MKFLMKLALDGIIPSDTTPHFLSSSVDQLFSGFLRVAEKLYKYTFSSQNTWVLRKTVYKPQIGRMPIIKATTHIENCDGNCDLNGRSILCVGGQTKYYPIYRHLVEASGGHLMTFHGSYNNSIKKLHELLEAADMVICPVDCVNHEAYFTVKRYCKYAEKNCVILDRSQLATFHKGIKTLATMTTKATKS